MQFTALTLPLAFAATWISIRLLLSQALADIALDRPNERSLHEHPVPKTGGLAMMSGIGLAWFMLPGALSTTVIGGALLLLCVSLADDLASLTPGIRLIFHFLAAAALVFPGYHGSWGVKLLLILGLVWFINLYNFMDGADGLAGGMTFFGFVCYGTAALIAGETRFALVNFSVAAAAVAFLRFNMHPARIFLGDCGSIPLGFLGAAIGFAGWQSGIWPWWFPLLVFSPFIVDASLTLLKRIYRRASITTAHREHYYQRLIQSGWGHRRTAYAEYLLMTAVGSSSLALLKSEHGRELWLLTSWVGIYVAVIALVEYRLFAKRGF